MKNKSKIRRLRHNLRQQELTNQKVEKAFEERKALILLRKKKRKAETKERSKKFYENRDAQWNSERHHDNLAVPSVITNEGYLFKKRSPLDSY